MGNVFLGGTCNDSKWRDKLIELLKPSVPYFNPVVDEWGEEDRLKEIQERETASYLVYVITPMLNGIYSIAEVVDDSNKRPEKTIFCILDKDADIDNTVYCFIPSLQKSLHAVKELVKSNGATVFSSLEEIAVFLNQKQFD